MAVNLFDANFYRAANRDLAAAGLTTDTQVFSHFQNYGLNEGRAFSQFVDLKFYRSSNADLSGFNNKQLFDHLQNFGVREDRHFSPFVDLKFYRQANSDLSQFSSEQAFGHLQTYGVNEGRAFSPFVDLKFYRQANSDLSQFNNAQALQHLEIYGINEGRQFSSLIDLNYYRQANSDLSQFNNAQALQHLENYGLNEGRQFSQYFSINYYKSHNADLVAAKLNNSQLLEHYELFGINEGRHGGSYQQGQILAGFDPTPDYDLVNHGGKTIANLSYANFYFGGSNSWKKSDIQNIDSSLLGAMSDKDLNNIMSQYFPGQQITSNFLGSGVIEAPVPGQVSQQYLETLISGVGNTGSFKGFDLGSTVFDFMLPEGTVLTKESSTSLQGLGGYHGSVNFTDVDGTQKTAYYAIGVYSQDYPYLGLTNGISVFDQPWKNVVATAYHELNEARTDADVGEVNRTGNRQLLGWYSDTANAEVGDYPIREAEQSGDLSAVFWQVPTANGQYVPVQYQYSNRVHGPEDPTTITTRA